MSTLKGYISAKAGTGSKERTSAKARVSHMAQRPTWAPMSRQTRRRSAGW